VFRERIPAIAEIAKLKNSIAANQAFFLEFEEKWSKNKVKRVKTSLF